MLGSRELWAYGVLARGARENVGRVSFMRSMTLVIVVEHNINAWSDSARMCLFRCAIMLEVISG